MREHRQSGRGAEVKRQSKMKANMEREARKAAREVVPRSSERTEKTPRNRTSRHAQVLPGRRVAEEGWMGGRRDVAAYRAAQAAYVAIRVCAIERHAAGAGQVR
jgi:hypothetical protein